MAAASHPSARLDFVPAPLPPRSLPCQSFYPLNYLVSDGEARAAPGPEPGAATPTLRVLSRAASGEGLERLELELHTGGAVSAAWLLTRVCRVDSSV